MLDMKFHDHFKHPKFQTTLFDQDLSLHVHKLAQNLKTLNSNI